MARRGRAQYRVFVSHAGDDIWVAGQIGRCIADCGATAFVGRQHIAAGDKFRERIHQEILGCNELLALLTPWSRWRAWVRHEIGMADILNKRIVCVFYQVTIADFGPDEGGLGPFDAFNIIGINELPTYFNELRRRVT